MSTWPSSVTFLAQARQMVGLRAVLHAVHAVDLDRRVGDVADHPKFGFASAR